MPTLPQQTEQTVFSSGALNYRSDAVNPAAFGATIGPALDKASDELSQVALARQGIYNENVATTNIAGVSNDAADTVTEYRKLQGQDAINALDATRAKLNQIVADRRATMNPAAARMFDFAAQRVLRSNLDSVDSHWDQQFKQSTVDSSKALMDASDRQGALHYNNPSAVGQFLQQKEQEVDRLGGKMGWTPEILADQHDKVRSEYLNGVVTAALADKDVNSATAVINQYRDSIDPKVIMGMEREIKQTQQAAYIDQEHAWVQQEHARSEQDRNAFNSFLPKLESGSLTADQVLRTAASPELKYRAMEMIKARDREETAPIRTNAPVMNGLMTDILENRMPDESRINQAYEGGQLSFTDFKRAQLEFQNSKSPDGSTLGNLRKQFNDSYKPVLDKSTMMTTDPQGSQNWYNFSRAVDQKVDEYRQFGKNPMDLFQPNNKDFVGNMAQMYVRSPMDIAKDQAAKMKAAAAASKDKSAPVKIDGDEDFAKLSPGTKFIGPDGQVRTKQ